MSRFTPAEIAYLRGQRLGRLATVDANGDLHVVPVGFRYNPEHDTIDIGGHSIIPTKKYRDALRHGRVAFVVDDVLPPWKPRFVEVRGMGADPRKDGCSMRAHVESRRRLSLRLADADLRGEVLLRADDRGSVRVRLRHLSRFCNE